VEKTNTFCVPVVLPTFIDRFLETLQRHTDPIFEVIVVDNSRDGVWETVRGRVGCYLRPGRNLGFAKSMNCAVKLATTRYVTCANDDVEFVDGRWWSGILETFERYPDAVAVNPESIKIPGWGYGEAGYFHLLPHQADYTRDDYDFLLAGDFHEVPGLPPSFPRQQSGVIDGITTWLAVFDTGRMRGALEAEKHEFGIENPNNNYFDERFYPGGGEDYDLNARMFRVGKRVIGTSTSWVYHHWSSSRTAIHPPGSAGPRDQAAGPGPRDVTSPRSDWRGWIDELTRENALLRDELAAKDYQLHALMPRLDPKRQWNSFDALWPPAKNEGHQVDIFGRWTAPDGTRVIGWRDPVIATVGFD
jgi:hypothetical protein